MFIDTHTHLIQFLGGKNEGDIETAKKDGTDCFIENASNGTNAPEVVKFAEARDDVYCAVAVHPWFVDTYAPSDVDLLRKLITTSKKIVGVGEIGLDYSHDAQTAEKQRQLYRDMIRLAREYGLPLNIHTDSDSFQDTLAILREEKAYEIGGMIHNYAGNVEEARELMDMGFYISVGIQIHNPQGNQLREVLRGVSVGQMVLESDMIFPPTEGRVQLLGDKITQPLMVRYIADKLAEIKGLAVAEVGAITSLNAKRLFGLAAKGI